MKQVLIRPILTEKTINLAETQKQYTFEVSLNATKDEIRKAVENKFEVKVTDVKVINILGKIKRFGAFRKPGKRKDIRKAIVKLAGKDTIDLFEMK